MKEQWMQQHYYLRVTWKALYFFACERINLKCDFHTNIELLQNHTEKQIMPFKTTVNWLFTDIWCYLVIGCFDWKIVVFQQAFVRDYYILRHYFIHHCKIWVIIAVFYQIVHWHHYIKIFCIIDLCIVHFTYAVSIWCTTFEYDLFIVVFIWGCLSICCNRYGFFRTYVCIIKIR